LSNGTAERNYGRKRKPPLLRFLREEVIELVISYFNVHWLCLWNYILEHIEKQMIQTDVEKQAGDNKIAIFLLMHKK